MLIPREHATLKAAMKKKRGRPFGSKNKKPSRAQALLEVRTYVTKWFRRLRVKFRRISTYETKISSLKSRRIGGVA